MTEPLNVDGLVVARAIAGDRDVLDGILAALQRPLYRYISRLLTHRETAEDALQEVLFRICKKIVWLRDPELLRPWAFRIASRECFRQLRSEKRRGEEILDLDTLETGASESIPQEWEHRLLDWVHDLPPASRAVIVLHYLEEMRPPGSRRSTRDFAGNCEVPVSLWSRAVAQAYGRYANEC